MWLSDDATAGSWTEIRHELERIAAFDDDTTARGPMYSPDGQTIAFILSNDTVAGFLGVTYLIDRDGTNMRRITRPEPCLIRPDWSPDGTRVLRPSGWP